jgi:hypothetical protein
MDRKPEWRKLIEGIASAILAAFLVFMWAAFIHHAGKGCPQGYIQGTPHWCK